MRRALFVLSLVACGPQSDTCELPPRTARLAQCDQGTYVFDDNGDGVTDHGVTYVTLSQRVRQERYDGDGDGELDSVVTWKRDGRGRDLARTVDEGADRSVDVVDTFTWVDDRLTSSLIVDRGTDGLLDAYRTMTYDVEGRLLEVRNDGDADAAVEGIADGVVDMIETWTYDAAGLVTVHGVDQDADGAPETVDRSEYDADGRLFRSSFDLGADGEDWWMERFYDDCGWLVTETYEDTDGEVSTTAFTWDDLGRIETITVDRGNDGQPDEVTTSVWRDNTEYVSVDSGADGDPDASAERDYDSAGVLVAVRSDFDADGRVDQAWSMPGGCQD